MSRGPTRIPRRWLHVIDEVIALRKGAVTGTGSKFTISAVDQRVSITKDQFEALCRRHGIGESASVLLEFMDAIGEIIYRPKFNRDLIIVDQNAAFFAVYQAANRGAFHSLLEKSGGRFMIKDLAAATKETVSGAIPLLELMVSLGTCFEIYKINGDSTYLAPLGLPESPPMKTVRENWDTQKELYEYAFMHDGFFHSLVSRIGVKLKADAGYWADGLYFNDEDNRCSVRLVRERGNEVGGSIRVEAQYPKGGDPAAARRYLSDIDAVVEEQEFDSGIAPLTIPLTRQGRNSIRRRAPPIIVERQPTLDTEKNMDAIIKELMRAMNGRPSGEISAIEASMGYPDSQRSGDRRAIDIVLRSLHENSLRKLHHIVQDVVTRSA